jgi:branched-chain amino acid transport system permease protein
MTAPAVAAHARVRRGDHRSLLGGIGLVGVLALLAGYVPFSVSLGTLTNLVGLYILVILATTWNLLAGYGGMVSIGQQAFVGIGGYGVIYLADTLHVPLLLALPAAALLCGLMALPASFLVFRLTGGYFAVGTWVVAEVVKLLTTQVDALGGGSGLSLAAFRGVDRVARIATVYWVSLAVAVGVVLATYLLMRSRLGLGLTAIRDNATAAASLGVAVTRSRRIVYMGASAGAGLAGALIAMNTLRVTPDSIYSVNYTAFMIFMVVIGGIGTIEGPILGAVVFYLIQDRLSQLGTWYLIILGAVAVVVVLLAPRGLWGAVSGHSGRLRLFPVGYTVGSRTGKETR